MKAFAETFKECVFYEFLYMYIYILIGSCAMYNKVNIDSQERHGTDDTDEGY